MGKVCINKIYPKRWGMYSHQEKEKKEREFNVVSFLLNSHLGKNCFREKKLYVEFYEEPDFIVYLADRTSEKIGLEVTKCYADEWNNHRVKSDLEKICKKVIEGVQNNTDSNCFCEINYMNVTFMHEIMVGGLYNKEELIAELKDVIMGKNRDDKKYVMCAEVGNSNIYPQGRLNIFINSSMAYWVPSIDEIIRMHEDAGVKSCDPVLRSIKEKEKKLLVYKQKSKGLINQWWLCIEVPEDAYMNPVSYQLPVNFDSEYDKIFIVKESFYGYGAYLVFGL